MPVYEFKCNDCNATFSELRKMGDTKAPQCPYCHGANTEKIFSVFASSSVKTSCSTTSGGG
ncbi:MAG: zinc ribbon domain-containing protein [Spirochaetota bacterium]